MAKLVTIYSNHLLPVERTYVFLRRIWNGIFYSGVVMNWDLFVSDHFPVPVNSCVLLNTAIKTCNYKLIAECIIVFKFNYVACLPQ